MFEHIKQTTSDFQKTTSFTAEAASRTTSPTVKIKEKPIGATKNTNRQEFRYKDPNKRYPNNRSTRKNGE